MQWPTVSITIQIYLHNCTTVQLYDFSYSPADIAYATFGFRRNRTAIKFELNDAHRIGEDYDRLLLLIDLYVLCYDYCIYLIFQFLLCTVKYF